MENRRREPKYIVDKAWFDDLMRSVASTMTILEVLADRRLTERLISLSTTLDEDLRASRLYTPDEVLGKE